MERFTEKKSDVSRAATGLFLCFSMLLCGWAQDADQEAAPAPVSEIPERFFQVQDANGFFWQAVASGALTSGETQYLQSGLNLLVGGAVFAPERGEVLEPGEGIPGRIRLAETRETVEIERDLLFDRERSAVRVLDTVSNTGSAAATIPVQVRTTYPFGWQSLHGTGGSLLSSDPVLSLGGNSGLVVHFSAAEGRHDTLLLSGNNGAVSPRLTASTNRRELTLGYELTIPAGGKVSLLHWISQLTLPEMGDAESAFSSFFRNGRLVDPGVDASDLSTVANFPETAQPDVAEPGAGANNLLALNAFLDDVGIHRRNSDLLWISQGSQLSGTVPAEARFTVTLANGDSEEIPVARVAAVRGGAGAGLPPRLFLRDGTVHAGSITAENLSIVPVNESEPQPLSVESLSLLLLRTEAQDGIAGEKTLGFLRLQDRSVVALKDPDFSLPAMAPWGTVDLKLSDIEELTYVSRPAPSCRVVFTDGSRYTVFLRREPLQITDPEMGAFEIDPGDLVQFWRVGRESFLVEPGEDIWLDFSEVPSGPIPEEGFLLRGNNLLSGRFADARLSLEASGATVSVETARIRSLRRSLEVTPGEPVPYILELKNGESVEGRIVEDLISISHNGSVLTVPTANLYAFRSPTS